MRWWPRTCRLLAAAVPWIGHAATRARGTIGGSLANADPAAELALVAVTLDATLMYRQAGRDGEIAAADFFLGPTMTALPAGACLTAVRFPVWRGERIGTSFHEVSARRSDFAFVSAAAQIALDADGRCERVALGIGAIADAPVRLLSVEAALIGNAPRSGKVESGDCRGAFGRRRQFRPARLGGLSPAGGSDACRARDQRCL